MQNKLKEMSSFGLHEKCIEIIKDIINNDMKILIAWAGLWNFEYLLINKIWINPDNIVSVDIEPEKFLIEEIECKKVDLNKTLPFENKSFDFIITLEVIEHLENQWSYISELKRVKKDDWYLLLSSPNIENIFNKLYFLFTNNLSHFSENDYKISWHINPLITWNFFRMLEKNNLELIKYDSNMFYFWIIPFLLKIKVPFKSHLFAQLNIFLIK